MTRKNDLRKTRAQRNLGKQIQTPVEGSNGNTDWSGALGLTVIVIALCLLLKFPGGLDSSIVRICLGICAISVLVFVGFWRIVGAAGTPIFLFFSICFGYSYKVAKENYHFLIPFLPSIFFLILRNKLPLFLWGILVVVLINYPETKNRPYGFILIVSASSVLVLRAFSRCSMMFNGPHFFETMAESLKSGKFFEKVIASKEKNQVKYLSRLLFFGALFQSVSRKTSESKMRKPIWAFSLISFLQTLGILVLTLTLIVAAADIHLGPVFKMKEGFAPNAWSSYLTHVIAELCTSENSRITPTSEIGSNLSLLINGIGVLFVLFVGMYFVGGGTEKLGRSIERFSVALNEVGRQCEALACKEAAMTIQQLIDFLQRKKATIPSMVKELGS